MRRHVASHMLKWLVTVQELLIILIIFPVIINGDCSSDMNKNMSSDPIKANLEMARAVTIWSIKEIFLRLAQSMMFTPTMNTFPKHPIMISTPKMIHTVHLTVVFIVTKRCPKFLMLFSKRLCLCDSRISKHNYYELSPIMSINHQNSLGL